MKGQKTMKKNGILFRVTSGLLAAALTLSLTACGGSSSNSDASAAADSADSGATHLRLIYSPSLCAAPMYIAIENGYFEDEGLDIEQVTVDAAHVSEAIGADQVDVGMGLIGKMLQPLENGLPIKFTTGIHTGCTKLLVPGDSDIKSIADLKGKKIGVPGLADAATVVSKRSLSAALWAGALWMRKLIATAPSYGRLWRTWRESRRRKRRKERHSRKNLPSTPQTVSMW